MTFVHYLWVGFQHVIPLGYDHILFIIALFLFNSHLKTAIIQCSLFTISHSLTLVLVALGILHFNVGIIESVIALSIFLVAFENLFSKQLHFYRLILIFIFGLVHGMGFANALAAIAIPQEQFITALLAFNCGVEVAQVFIIILCYYLLARPFSNKTWYKSTVVQPVSISIACIALFWSVERFLTTN
jgi:hydrogenase/urease accessory protein HupE